MEEIYKTLYELEKKGESAVLCIVIAARGSTPRNSGSKMLVFKDGNILGTVGGGEVEANCIKEALTLRDSQPSKILKYQLIDPQQGDPGICGGEVEIYLEHVGNSQGILIFGAGHVGKSLCFLSKWSGFRVTIIDDRTELLDEVQFSGVNKIEYSTIDGLSSKIIIDSRSIVVLTTRNMDIDIDLIPWLLNQHPLYIGVIGSARRWISAKNKLLSQGINPDELEKIYSPIGLDLDAETPEEIAISIMAEILKVRNSSSGNHLNFMRRE
jgi:xanthine dehydrogenase accessory factor